MKKIFVLFAAVAMMLVMLSSCMANYDDAYDDPDSDYSDTKAFTQRVLSEYKGVKPEITIEPSVVYGWNDNRLHVKVVVSGDKSGKVPKGSVEVMMDNRRTLTNLQYSAVLDKNGEAEGTVIRYLSQGTNKITVVYLPEDMHNVEREFTRVDDYYGAAVSSDYTVYSLPIKYIGIPAIIIFIILIIITPFIIISRKRAKKLRAKAIADTEEKRKLREAASE
ncbi:MAG: hypothetical protein LBS74_03280 [Oscillospiraceae bacterium]|jgi:hypothetical protein|nr:hypothetical protein [Oscillospiraceae bacterium]